MGQVNLAKRLCFSTCIPNPRTYVNNTKGMMPADKTMCVNKMKK